MGKISKVDYSSKTKGFNFCDFFLPRDTVHTREGFQILSKNYQINDLGTVHEPPNPRRLVRGIAAGDPSRRVDRTQCCGVVRANRAD